MRVMSLYNTWDAITWTVVLAIVPYGWTVVGALLLSWIVWQLGLDRKKDEVKSTRTQPSRPGNNREVWREFYGEDKF